MSIKRKDGTEFRLRGGPIEAMKSQRLWTGYVLRNMNRFSARTSYRFDDPPPLPVKSAEKPPAPKEPESPPPPPPKIEVPIEIVPEPIPEPAVASKDKRVPEDRKTIVHCLPATVTVSKDFYGDSKRKVNYGPPFTLEAVLVSQNDIEMTLWSPTELAKGSVLFPKTPDVRWWKVQTAKPFDDGFLVHSGPSDYTPSFGP